MKHSAWVNVLACAAGGFALLSLAGWVSNNAYLTSVHPTLASMKPVTALSILGIALAILVRQNLEKHGTARVFAVLSAMAGALTIAEYWFAVDLGVGRLAALSASDRSASFRMAESTATSITLLACAFLLCEFVPSLARPFTLVSGMIPLLALFGYVYGFRALYDVPFFSSMALNTALALCALCAAQVLSGRRRQPSSAEASPVEFIREVVILSVTVPFLLGWLTVLGLRSGLMETPFAIALLTISTIVVLSVATLRSLRRSAALEANQREVSAQAERLAQLELALAEDRYRSLIINSLDLFVTHDLEGTILSTNPAVVSTLGYTEDQIVGRNLRHFLTERGLRGFDAYITELMSNKLARGFMEVMTASGETKLLEYQNTLEKTADGVPIAHGHSRDVTERIRAENRVRQSETRYRTLFERNLAGTFSVNAAGSFLEANDALVRMLGYGSREELLALHPSALYADPEDRLPLLARLQAEEGLKNVELRLRRKDGSTFWGLTSLALLDAPEGSGRIVQGSVLDITDRKLAEHRLWERAHHDSLTGLPNRVLFVDRLSTAIAHAQRHGLQVAVCFADLDLFKAINDEHGHAAGDFILQQVSARIAGRIRATDSVGRMGGDEFAVFLADLHDASEAESLARELIALIHEPFEWGTKVLHAGGSIGISMYPREGADPDILLRHADRAMYAAKSSGRGSVVMFHDLPTPGEQASRL